jgi:hypothetical protein
MKPRGSGANSYHTDKVTPAMSGDKPLGTVNKTRTRQPDHNDQTPPDKNFR